MHTFSFEKLEVWHDCRSLVKEVYQLSEQFPKGELFGLVSQIRRAVISVPSNIAEGSSRKTDKEQARFYQIAYSSLMEVLNQLILAVDLGFITEIDLVNIRMLIEKISWKINKLCQARREESGEGRNC